MSAQEEAGASSLKDPDIDPAAISEAAALEPWTDLFAQQAALELGMAEAGRRRSEQRRTAAAARGEAAEVGGTRRAVDAYAAALAETLRGAFDKAAGGGPGRPVTKLRDVAALAPETAAVVVLRTLFNRLTEVAPFARVAIAVGTALEDELRLTRLRALDRRRFERLRAGGRSRRRGGRDRRAAPDGGDEGREWSVAERELLGAHMIGAAIEATGAAEIANRKQGGRVVKELTLSSAAAAWIARQDQALDVMRPVYEPMIAPPKPWRGPFGGGYLTRGVRPLTLVKTQHRAYLEDLTSVDMQAVYRAVNAAQATPWRVSPRVFETMTRLRDAGLPIPGAPSLEPDAPATDSPETATNDDPGVRARRWAEARTRRSRRLAFDMAFQCAARYRRMPRLFFPMTMDFRGRLYAAPSVNPQGPDATRALFEFARATPLGPEGWKWLAIHLANVGDFERTSKTPLADRVRWTLRHTERILACAADPLAETWWREADRPWQFLAACFEWEGFQTQGEAFGSRLPVALDGTCSGIQHFSLALRDEAAGQAVNLTPSALCQDIYQRVANEATRLIEADRTSAETLAWGFDDEGAPREAPVSALAQEWLRFGVTRAVCKRPTMTYGYGARSYGYAEQILADTLAPAAEAHRRSGGAPSDAWPFEHGAFPAALYLAARLTEAIEQVVLKAAETMSWLQSMASLAAREGQPLCWVTPDGFPVLQAYRNSRARRVRTHVAGDAVALYVREPRAGVDVRLQRQGVSPNFVHSLDAAHLRLTVDRARGEGIRDFALIHDSFGAPAAHTPRFFEIIREAMADMYASVDVIETFQTEILAPLAPRLRSEAPTPPRRGALDVDAVLESEFAFS